MADLETVNLRRDGAAATIELNRPETLNAWNAQLGHDLLAAVTRGRRGRRRPRRGDHRRRPRVLLRRRPARPDRREQRTPEGQPDVRTVLTERYHPIITTIRSMPKPVVSAVNGPAVGIGLSLALAADLVVAAESAYFLLAFVNIGLVPDGGSSLFVPARVGFARATEMAMLGERIPAPKALEWGLINRVVADDAFTAEVAALRDRLAAGPTRSYAGTKRQLNRWPYARMEEQLELEADDPAGDGGLAGLRRGGHGLRPEAPTGVRRALSRATYVPSSAGL